MGNALEHRMKSLKRELGVDFDMLFREIAKPGQPVVNYLLGEDGPDGGEDLDPNLEGGDRTDVVTMWSHYMEGQKDDPDKDLYDKHADFCVVTGQGNLAKLYKDLIPKIEKIRKQARSKGVTKYKGVEKYKDVAMGNCRNSMAMTFTQRLKGLLGKEEQVSVSQDTYTQAIHKFKQDRLKKEAKQLAKRSVIKFL